MELRSKQAFRTSLPLILRTRLRLAYGGLLRRCYNPCRMYQKHFKYIFIIYINKTHKVNKIMLRNTKISWQTHYKIYFHKSWREEVRHRAKRLFLGLPLARAVRLSYQRTYSLHEPRVLAIYSSPSLTEIVVLPKLRKKRDLQL